MNDCHLRLARLLLAGALLSGYASVSYAYASHNRILSERMGVAAASPLQSAYGYDVAGGKGSVPRFTSWQHPSPVVARRTECGSQLRGNGEVSTSLPRFLLSERRYRAAFQ